MIACLGWGSLIWNLDGLPVEHPRGHLREPASAPCAPGEGSDAGDWRPDGPPVRVEFARRSRCRACGGPCQSGPLTLVLYDAAPVPSLWARMIEDDLEAAVNALAHREGCSAASIGPWSSRDPQPPNIIGLRSWASQREIGHTIWTALGPKFHDDPPHAPNDDEAIAYLSNLDDHHQSPAEKYVRCAPRQIDTAYRRRIIRNLGWTALS